jgi:hypothetical protein
MKDLKIYKLTLWAGDFSEVLQFSSKEAAAEKFNKEFIDKTKDALLEEMILDSDGEYKCNTKNYEWLHA